MAVPAPKTPTRRRFAQDPAAERRQEEIFKTMDKNKNAAVKATWQWIRRVYVKYNEDRQLHIHEAGGAAWKTRIPTDPQLSAEDWVYPAYGENIVEDLNHDVSKALRGILDEPESSQ
jgi:hypothetical protein